MGNPDLAVAKPGSKPVHGSAVDVNHPELAGSIADSFDALSAPATPHQHGTAIAGLIAAHAKLMGAAPDAKILAVRAFDPKDVGAEGTTFNILKAIDWAAAHGARIINMSFAGPADPAIHRSLEAARKKGIVLVAAAGNAGAKSPPLYPAADPNVIAVSATDADDKLFEQSNHGRHITVDAPGAQILVAVPRGGSERDRRAHAPAQAGSDARQGEGHSTRDRQRSRTERTRCDVRCRPCRCLWRAHCGDRTRGCRRPAAR